MHEVTINNMTKEELEINWQDFNEEQKGFVINRLICLINEGEDDTEVSALESRVDELEGAIDDLENKIEDLEEENEGIKGEVEELKEKIEGLREG